jgi:hypothetical protein
MYPGSLVSASILRMTVFNVSGVAPDHPNPCRLSTALAASSRFCDIEDEPCDPIIHDS